ncbi:hypothetical protein N1030_01505 [Desulfovibrio mangrovi]|uniref:hypothetical protein n=1 Tax=Desulfovibrio mangrovi TaxID=2976983 RepID=UPI0022464478|nr:hypothetical protein [Desulfovibrio mangrovi]UZP67670.1 hypothetical protein N1030_01505 [Desulfovibrio mangrovi]
MTNNDSISNTIGNNSLSKIICIYILSIALFNITLALIYKSLSLLSTSDFLDAFIFSISIYNTLYFGEIQPNGALGKTLIAIHSIIGTASNSLIFGSILVKLMWSGNSISILNTIVYNPQTKRWYIRYKNYSQSMLLDIEYRCFLVNKPTKDSKLQHTVSHKIVLNQKYRTKCLQKETGVIKFNNMLPENNTKTGTASISPQIINRNSTIVVSVKGSHIQYGNQIHFTQQEIENMKMLCGEIKPITTQNFQDQIVKNENEYYTIHPPSIKCEECEFNNCNLYRIKNVKTIQEYSKT